MIRKLLLLWLAGVACAFAQTDPTQIVYGPFSVVGPYNNSTGYSLVPDSQIQPSTVMLDTNTFTSTSNFTTLEKDDATASFSVASNVGTVVTGTASSAYYVLASNTNAAYQGPDLFAEMEITQNGTNSGTDQVGLFFGTSSTRVIASVDAVAGSCAIKVYKSSAYTTIGSASCTLPSAPWYLGLEVVGNYAELWKNTGSGWSYVYGAAISATYDTRVVGNMSGWETGLFTYTSQATTWKFANLKTSVFGGVGARDISLVRNYDGSPYYAGTKAYFLATIAGANGVPDASEGVFSFDLNTHAIVFLSAILMQDGSSIYADQSGQLLINPVTNTQIVLMTTWVESSTKIVYASFAASSMNILSGGVFVVPVGTSFTLSSGGYYDPYMYCETPVVSTGACSLWGLEAAAGPGIKLYTSTVSPSANSWTLFASDSANCEGPKLACMNLSGANTFFPISACVANPHYARVYTSSLTFLGNVTATMPLAVSTVNPPHINIFSWGNTSYLLTFDETTFASINESMGNIVLASATIKPAIGCTPLNATFGSHSVGGLAGVFGNQGVQ